MRNEIRKRLFGTDGIRSRVGKFPLDSSSLVRLGRTVGHLWEKSKILIGRDTRESGAWLEGLIASGLRHSAEVHACRVIPTPGLSYVMDQGDFDLGIMLTASHNPYFDNGIKFFSRGGEKISDEAERKIEDIFYSAEMIRNSHAAGPAEVTGDFPAAEKYEQFLFQQAAGIKSAPLRCVVDCANGATHIIAPRVLEKTGLRTIPIHTDPDGRNINENCGSTDLTSLKQNVSDLKADLGIAFDGDGDRVLFVDPRGGVIDGDLCLYVIAEYLSRTNQNFNRVLVGTIMTNLGLEKALHDRGIELVRTDVGDRFVSREMKRRNAVLGGEKSGHIIIRELQKSGDGILTALYFLKSLDFLKIDIEAVNDLVALYPQVEKNIPIREKKELKSWRELNELVDHFTAHHGETSRVVIRYSGTEPKIRLMMEARERDVIERNLGRFVDLIETTIGE